MATDATHRRAWQARAEKAEAALADAEAEIVELKAELAELEEAVGA